MTASTAWIATALATAAYRATRRTRRRRAQIAARARYTEEALAIARARRDSDVCEALWRMPSVEVER